MAAFPFDLFGDSPGLVQDVGDVIRYIVTAEVHPSGEDRRSVSMRDHVGGAAADVDQNRAHLLFFRGEHDFRIRQALEDDPSDIETAALNALALVLTDRAGSGYDEHPAFQPVSEHIDRVFDSALSVDLKILHEGMENLAILRKLECPGDFQTPEDVPRLISCSGLLIPTTPVEGIPMICPRRCRQLRR